MVRVTTITVRCQRPCRPENTHQGWFYYPVVSGRTGRGSGSRLGVILARRMAGREPVLGHPGGRGTGQVIDRLPVAGDLVRREQARHVRAQLREVELRTRRGHHERLHILLGQLEGTPTTAHSSTEGWLASASSTSAGER